MCHDDDDYKKSKFNIFDLVLINKNINHDVGCAGQLGYVVNYRVNHSFYVFSYDARAKQYSYCGFDENELSTVGMNLVKNSTSTKVLYKEMKNYLQQEDFKYCSDYFRAAWQLYKKGYSFEECINMVKNLKRIEDIKDIKNIKSEDDEEKKGWAVDGNVIFVDFNGRKGRKRG